MPEDSVRLDRWLWAARFYKTRGLATEAATGGKIHVNGERAKPAKPLRVGDAVRVRQPPFEYHIVVRALAGRRGPSAAARALYQETAESLRARETLAAQLRLLPAVTYRGKGRPTKKARRDIDRFKPDA